MATESDWGAHPFTIGWWRRLPTCYRAADRVQGYPKMQPWHGMNRDPRFFTGWDAWHRANISTRPWVAAVSFTRTFRAAPRVPLHIRSFHRPVVLTTTGERVMDLEQVRVRHIVRNYTGQIIADHSPALGSPGAGNEVILEGGGVIVADEDIYEGGSPAEAGGEIAPEAPRVVDGRLEFHTLVTPDRFGTVHVTVEVHLDVTDLDLLDDQPVGPRDLMDAVHVGTQDTTWSGLPTLDRYTAASPYPLLRYMDGIGHQFGYLSDAVNSMHDGTWVHPESAPEESLMFLSTIMGVSGRYARSLSLAELRQHLVDLYDNRSPTPGSRQHIALTARQWLRGTRDVAVTPAHALPGWEGADPLHTLVVRARADEVPGNDLKAFENFLNDSGVIPAGHRVVVREERNTWDQFEAASGSTWEDQAKVITTWNQADSAGVNLADEGA